MKPTIIEDDVAFKHLIKMFTLIIENNEHILSKEAISAINLSKDLLEIGEPVCEFIKEYLFELYGNIDSFEICRL